MLLALKKCFSEVRITIKPHGKKHENFRKYLDFIPNDIAKVLFLIMIRSNDDS